MGTYFHHPQTCCFVIPKHQLNRMLQSHMSRHLSTSSGTRSRSLQGYVDMFQRHFINKLVHTSTLKTVAAKMLTF